jgi:subtilase family serine protease
LRVFIRQGLLCASALAACIGIASAADAAAVADNVAGWVASAPKAGTADDRQSVSIAVHMALRDREGLRQLADAVSKPGNAASGHYLTAAAFRSRFAPDAADVAAVEAMLKAAGMTEVHAGPAGVYVSARATVGALRGAFGITQDLYRHGTMTLRANLEAPRIPDALAGKVLFIEGLDETDLLRRPHHVSATQGERLAPASLAASKARPAITPPPVAANLPSPYCSTYFGDTKAVLTTKPGPYDRTLPWLVCGYTPQQIRAAYGLSQVKFDGTGLTIAILDAYASPTIVSDGNAYAKNHSLPPLTAANFTQIVPEGIYNVNPGEACEPYGWWGEESLDVAAVHGAAPGATIVYVGARDCGTSLSVALDNVVYNQIADIVTNSYSYNGEDVSLAQLAEGDQTLMAAAAQGQTVMFSSGDDGDLSQLNGVATGAYASTSPYATGVGGTSLAVLAPSGRKYEWGWGNYRDFLGGAQVNSAKSVSTTGLETATNFGVTYYDFSFYSGAGGGVSLLEREPDYQKHVVPGALATTLNLATGQTTTLTPHRVSPDVAMVADPYTGYLYGETFTIAGNTVSDAGCTPTSDTTEYCEGDIGGTSLASPLFAGVMAVVDQARLAAGKPVVGFANPWLYGARIGATMNSAGINDIVPPASATAVLRGYADDPTRVRVVTIASVPFDIVLSPVPLEVCGLKICEGLDDVFNYTTVGYDDVTGLGVPYAPYLVTQ